MLSGTKTGWNPSKHRCSVLCLVPKPQPRGAGGGAGEQPSQETAGEGNTGPPPSREERSVERGGQRTLTTWSLSTKKSSLWTSVSAYRHWRGAGSWWRGAHTWGCSARLTGTCDLERVPEPVCFRFLTWEAELRGSCLKSRWWTPNAVLGF